MCNLVYSVSFLFCSFVDRICGVLTIFIYEFNVFLCFCFKHRKISTSLLFLSINKARLYSILKPTLPPKTPQGTLGIEWIWVCFQEDPLPLPPTHQQHNLYKNMGLLNFSELTSFTDWNIFSIVRSSPSKTRRVDESADTTHTCRVVCRLQSKWEWLCKRGPGGVAVTVKVRSRASDGHFAEICFHIMCLCEILGHSILAFSKEHLLNGTIVTVCDVLPLVTRLAIYRF